MAHFAELDKNNKVLRVVIVANDVLLDDDGVEQESTGIAFCQKLLEEHGNKQVTTVILEKLCRSRHDV